MPVDPPLDIGSLVSSALRHQVRLSEFSEPVYIEEAQAFDDLVSLIVRTRDGRTEQVIVQATELSAGLEQAAQESAGGELANPQDFFLLIEAARIRLAYSFDPFFAVSLSGVQALPHQLQAVYERMLPQARLRFLLADDPGAGKTIMAGLLLKELKLRGAIGYVLILTPAPLTIQWQDELYSKFDETFGYSHWTWWINRAAIPKPPSGCFSSIDSPERPSDLGVRLHSSAPTGIFTHLPTT
jgi:SNF2 family DNA or RNA helicase